MSDQERKHLYTADSSTPGLRLNREDGGLVLNVKIGGSVFIEGANGAPLQAHLIRIEDDTIRLRFSEPASTQRRTAVIRESVICQLMAGAVVNTQTAAGKLIARFANTVLRHVQKAS